MGGTRTAPAEEVELFNRGLTEHLMWRWPAVAKRTCSIPGCDKAEYTRSWCQRHYKHWKSTGDPGPAAIPACSLLDCDKPVRYNGMCRNHADNERHYGHATPMRDWPLIARVMHFGWDVTARGCWEWRGALNDCGYGLMSAPRLGLDGARVHRVMWEMHNGPIPDDLVVRHRCDNPPCVNPDHLALGTHAENMGDMAERGRSRAYSTGRYDGVCINGKHDVTQPGALKQVTKKGGGTYWTCVGCDQDRKRKHEAKKAGRKAAREKAA